MTFDKALGGCFSGSLDFAAHPTDERRAFAWLGTLREREIGLRAALEQVKAILTEKKCARGSHPKRIRARDSIPQALVNGLIYASYCHRVLPTAGGISTATTIGDEMATC